MKYWFFIFIFVLLAGSVFAFSDKDQTNLISPLVAETAIVTVTPVTVTPTATPSATPIATTTATPKVVTKKVAPKPKPTPTAESTERVNALVDKYSIEYGLNPNVVRHLSLCESGFRTNATNGKYVGLFQYDIQTWEKIRREMGKETNPELRYSPEEAIRTTSYALSRGKSKLWPNCIP